jgi:hypothetical protein
MGKTPITFDDTPLPYNKDKFSYKEGDLREVKLVVDKPFSGLQKDKN